MADRGHSVPFLPVNAELSPTRNQARQKLGRLNAREFATLLIDLLSEAKRRQQGGMVFPLKGSIYIFSIINISCFTLFLFRKTCKTT